MLIAGVAPVDHKYPPTPEGGGVVVTVIFADALKQTLAMEGVIVTVGAAPCVIVTVPSVQQPPELQI